MVEPHRIKTVERIELRTREARARIIRDAFYSVTYLDAADVFVDLGTDSGTGALSDQQWSALMRGDEAYVRSRNFPPVSMANIRAASALAKRCAVPVFFDACRFAEVLGHFFARFAPRK